MLGLSMTTNNTTTYSENSRDIQVLELDETQISNVQMASGWAELDGRGLIRVSGDEAESFLQGQLTQDLALVKKGQALLAAHCTPKGKVLSLFRCSFWNQQFYLDLTDELEASALKRLTMYKLRAKVQLESASESVSRTAIWGEDMRAVFAHAGLQIPDKPGETVQSSQALLACVSHQCWYLLSTPEFAENFRSQLALHSTSDPQAWVIENIKAGIPEVFALTSDTWIPQMLNLDHLQGVSFKKGCYTGQEIVARAHFLGRVKRRMRLFSYQGETPPIPGQKLTLNSARGAAASGNPNSMQTENKEGDEESSDTLHVVWAGESQPGQGWVLAVTQLSPIIQTETTENKK
jgi:hypothetical protein